MNLMADSEELRALFARLTKADFITVDTEFLRDSTYWPKLCLLQIAGPEEADVAAIDPLAPGLDLAPVFALFNDPGIVKVLPSARQDTEISIYMSAGLPAPLFASHEPGNAPARDRGGQTV